MPADQPTVEIVFPPAGEAPLWVREKWVGLRLPVVLREAKPVRALTAGVLTGPRGCWLLSAGCSWAVTGVSGAMPSRC
jgi:hypothetical protein